ncbi:MAG: hypothetical protein ABJA93_03375 [Sporichthyaceae bacterium]
MPTAYATIVRFCTTCRGDVSFEQPECPDGHGSDCPEWVCVECGDALLVGFPGSARVAVAHPTSHVA